MYPCEMQEQTTRPTLSVRFRAPVQDLPMHFGRVYGAIMGYLGELKQEHAGPAFAIYYNMDMQNLDIEAGFPVATALRAKGEIQASSIPGGTYAVCHYTGPYAEVGPAYEELAEFANDHGYAPGGIAYEWYLNGPDVPPQDLKTDLAFPLVPIKHGEAI